MKGGSKRKGAKGKEGLATPSLLKRESAKDNKRFGKKGGRFTEKDRQKSGTAISEKKNQKRITFEEHIAVEE